MVPKLTIGNSYSKIEGLSPDDFKRLRKLLSYKPDQQAAYFAGGHYPALRYVIDNKGSFATGLLHRVVDFLTVTCPWMTVDNRRKPVGCKSAWINLEAVKPYQAQRDAVIAAVSAKHGTISMPTGTGKSYVIALLIGQLALKTLVVVPSLEIKQQLTKSLAYTMGSLLNVTVENIDSKALQTATDYDVLIIDEAHHVAAKTYHKLNKTAWTNIPYRFFMTATPFRNQTEETLLFESIAGEVIYSLDYRKAVTSKYIVPVEAYYIEIPKQKTDAYTWAQVYSELVVKHMERNMQIALLAARLNNAKKSTLVLVKEIKHGTILAELSGLPFANGQDEGSRDLIQQYNRGEISTLIGTEGILGEGVDTKPCEYVIIAGLGKAKSAFMQKVGRAVRNYPGKESAKVILIKDLSHKFCSRHYHIQCAILLTEYGIKPSKIEL